MPVTWSVIRIGCVGLLVITSITCAAQKRSFGLRLGEPIGVTYKKYTSTNKSIEFIIGTASPNWRKDYYRKSFDDYKEYSGDTYQSHKAGNPVYLQARYLLHYPIQTEGMEGKLEWYWGAGALLKAGKITYTYRQGPPENTVQSDSRSNIDFGPDGILGVEYTFEDIDLNVFGEASLLFELADRPLTFQAFGAVGARFIF